MRQTVSSFAVGLLFGMGLVVAQMTDPAKVLAFLDIFGNWDPSLALVMAGAVAVASLGFAAAGRRAAPLWASTFRIPTRRDLDARLITGSALFGIGWGLVGLCPGPALTVLPLGLWQGTLFVAAMLAGMALHQLLRAVRP
jgi:uncharacterized membrane protein YedE/YeeE